MPTRTPEARDAESTDEQTVANTTPSSWRRVVEEVAAGHWLDAEGAAAILATTDEETLALVGAAGELRRRHFSNTVKVNYLVNLKSGLCPEDCTYCSQRLGSAAQILKYTRVDAYNHNLDTAESSYEDTCTTHDFADRVATVQAAKTASPSLARDSSSGWAKPMNSSSKPSSPCAIWTPTPSR